MTLTECAHNFLNTAKEQYEVLDGMASKMSSLFADTAKYFAFDPKKYAMEDFFSDLKAFCTQFTVSDQSVLNSVHVELSKRFELSS